MKTQPLLFKVFRNGSKIKSIRLMGQGDNLLQGDIHEEIRAYEDHDVIFYDAKTNAIETGDRLINVLCAVEKCSDTKLLNRIIRGGGFVEYVKKLEGEVNGHNKKT